MIAPSKGLSIVCGLILGAALGATAGNRLAIYRDAPAHDPKTTREPDQTLTIMWRLEGFDALAATGDKDPTAERALQYKISATESFATTAPGPEAPLLKADEGLFLARLAILQESSGRQSEARESMGKAQQTLGEAGWKDFSEASIRMVLRRLDNRWKTGVTVEQRKGN